MFRWLATNSNDVTSLGFRTFGCLSGSARGTPRGGSGTGMPRGLCIGSTSTGSFRRHVCHGSASSAGASAAAVSSGADAAVAGAGHGADAAVVCSDRSSHAMMRMVMMTIVMMTMTMQMGHGGDGHVHGVANDIGSMHDRTRIDEDDVDDGE